MSTQEQFFQQFESLFEHYNQALTPSSEINHHSTSEESDRLVAAARLAIEEIAANEDSRGGNRRYFAKPGEAEWGC